MTNRDSEYNRGYSDSNRGRFINEMHLQALHNPEYAAGYRAARWEQYQKEQELAKWKRNQEDAAERAGVHDFRNKTKDEARYKRDANYRQGYDRARAARVQKFAPYWKVIRTIVYVVIIGLLLWGIAWLNVTFNGSAALLL